MLNDTDGEGEYGIVAPTYADAWTKCVEGKAGLLKALGTRSSEINGHRSRTVRSARRTYGQVIMHNGIIVYVDSAAEGGLRIQGRNLKGAWADEIGLWEKWETTWNESLRYAVREGISKIIATGTPKASRPARKLVRALIRNDPGEGGVIVRRLRTIDNAANLSDAFLRAVIGAAQGTRLERQELEGELLDDVANALWTRDMIDSIRVSELAGHLRNVYVGVDPSDGAEDSDEQAYTVAGRGCRRQATCTWPRTGAGRRIRPASPSAASARPGVQVPPWWSRRTTAASGSPPCSPRCREMGTSVRVQVVHASDAKRTRAEPVAAMYQRYSEDGQPLVLHLHRRWKTPTGTSGRTSTRAGRPDGDLYRGAG